MRITAHRFSFLCFIASASFLILCYGIAIEKYHLFPYRVLVLAGEGYRALFHKDDMFYNISKYPHRPVIYNTGRAYEGLTLVTRAAARNVLSAEIIDLDGKKIHEWIIDWHKIWPDAKDVPNRLFLRRPRYTEIHGAIIMENGDLIFNFHGLGLARIDLQGKVVWRLNYKTHHSVCKGDDGNLWVCSFKEHIKRDIRFPDIMPPFIEEIILKVSPEGKIIQEWSIPELLIKNDLTGLLYLRFFGDKYMFINYDILHLNDVETFPATLKEEFFKRGDVLVSLRDINTVFVFNRESGKISFVITGMFIRQHDSDFIDGNTFSVFDNHSIAPGEDSPKSRIVIVSAPDKTLKVFFRGNPKVPFYTDVCGKHQWLPNGNLLITEFKQGRVFEIDQHGEIVWEHNNYVGNGLVGTVTEAQRLPSEYTRLFIGLGPDKSETRRIHDKKMGTIDAKGGLR